MFLVSLGGVCHTNWSMVIPGCLKSLRRKVYPSVEGESPHSTGDSWDTMPSGGTYFPLLLIRETWIILRYTKLDRLTPNFVSRYINTIKWKIRKNKICSCAIHIFLSFPALSCPFLSFSSLWCLSCRSQQLLWEKGRSAWLSPKK